MDLETLRGLTLFQLKEKWREFGLPDQFSKPTCIEVLLAYQKDREAANLLTSFADGGPDKTGQGQSLQSLQSENKDLRKQLHVLNLQLQQNSMRPDAHPSTSQPVNS